MGAVTIEFDPRDLHLAIGELVAATGREVSDCVEQQARLLVEEAIDLTPPSGGGVTGLAARARGEAAVERDLTGSYGLFVGVRLKGRRKITTVFGRKLKKPIYVPTKELHPDVRGIYDARSGKRFSGGSRTLDSKARGQKAAWYVDRAKLDVLRKEQKAKVGKLASGWVPALRALQSQAPQWIERQIAGGTRGRVTIDLDSDAPEIEAAAQVKGSMESELNRRLLDACAIRAATIRRAIPHILERAIKTARL